MGTSHPLDNPVRAALAGPHAHLAEAVGQALRYPSDVAPFAALPTDPTAEQWRDLATLVGPGGTAVVAGPPSDLPAGWELTFDLAGVQLVAESVVGTVEPEAVQLGPADVPEMLDLVARTQPGPFATRTIELGRYLGIRRDGVLVAMAGERMHPPGWTEISAVCTDPAHRRQGLADRLVRTLVLGIRDRGETPFLHATATNESAIRLYLAMGFRLRQQLRFRALRAPGGSGAPIGSRGGHPLQQ